MAVVAVVAGAVKYSKMPVFSSFLFFKKVGLTWLNRKTAILDV
jgi:hypothetical protein